MIDQIQTLILRQSENNVIIVSSESFQQQNNLLFLQLQGDNFYLENLWIFLYDSGGGGGGYGILTYWLIMPLSCPEMAEFQPGSLLPSAMTDVTHYKDKIRHQMINYGLRELWAESSTQRQGFKKFKALNYSGHKGGFHAREKSKIGSVIHKYSMKVKKCP